MADKGQPILMPGGDEAWFAEHKRRFLHIRPPRYTGEFSHEFATLGFHDVKRRAVIAVRTFYGIIHIPFLKFADETIEDTDEILRPIIEEMMRERRGSLDL